MSDEFKVNLFCLEKNWSEFVSKNILLHFGLNLGFNNFGLPLCIQKRKSPSRYFSFKIYQANKFSPKKNQQ